MTKVTKKVKEIEAWAIVFTYDSVVTPTVFSTRELANTYFKSRVFKEHFCVVPCTITYSLPLQPKKKMK